jgi:hypothetical protein
VIRYALVIIVATSVLGLTGVALDETSTVRGEQAIEAELSTVESAATSLYEFERTSRSDSPGTARRVVEIDVPGETRTMDGTSFLRFERIPDSDATRVIYRIDGGTNRTRLIRVPLQGPDGGPVELLSRSGTHRLIFELGTDTNGDPVVVAGEYGEKRDPDPTI